MSGKNNQAENVIGKAAPASMLLPYWSTYLWLKNGKNYRQMTPGTSNGWEEIKESSTPFPPAESEVALGQSLYVSSKGKTVADGAVRESISSHFSSLDEAVAAAQAGDTIYVYGDHTINATLSKEGVKYHFFGNGIINCQATPFTDVNDVTAFHVRGDARFDIGLGFNLLRVTDPATVYDIECHSATTRGYVLVYLGGGTAESTLKVTSFLENTFDDHTVYLTGAGQGTIICPKIKNSATVTSLRVALYVVNAFVGSVHVIGDIVSENSENAIAFNSNAGVLGLVTVTGNVYGSTDPYGSTWEQAAIRIFAGRLHLTGDIYGYDRYCVLTTGSGNELVHVGNMYNEDTRPCILVSSSATIDLKGTQRSLGSVNTLETSQVGGTFRHSGRIENKFVSGAIARGIDLAASASYTAIFDNTVIVVDDGFAPEGLRATSNKNIVVTDNVASNAPHVNITNLVTGSNLFSDTNII